MLHVLKNMKKHLRYHYFTLVYQKSWWHDLQFLRYRAWQTEIGNLVILGCFLLFYPTPPLLYILVFHEPPIKIGFFSEPPIKFFILNPSHLLKVTKFLVKISQFKFLVMTEKNIFVYKLFLLNISDFISDHSVHSLPPSPPWKKLIPSFPAIPL